LKRDMRGRREGRQDSLQGLINVQLRIWDCMPLSEKSTGEFEQGSGNFRRFLQF
jgi:hypothetical protein